jgi:hypothetical protein
VMGSLAAVAVAYAAIWSTATMSIRREAVDVEIR